MKSIDNFFDRIPLMFLLFCTWRNFSRMIASAAFSEFLSYTLLLPHQGETKHAQLSTFLALMPSRPPADTLALFSVG